MRLGAASPLRARLPTPQIDRRQPDAKTLRDHRWRQTGLVSQQHPLAQVGRIGVGHYCLLSRPKCPHSTHKQDVF